MVRCVMFRLFYLCWCGFIILVIFLVYIPQSSVHFFRLRNMPKVWLKKKKKNGRPKCRVHFFRFWKHSVIENKIEAGRKCRVHFFRFQMRLKNSIRKRPFSAQESAKTQKKRTRHFRPENARVRNDLGQKRPSAAKMPATL